MVKEADALQAAGFEVTVLASDHFEPVRRLDRSILERVAWRSVLLRPQGGRIARLLGKLRREVCRIWVVAGRSGTGVAIHANFERHQEFVSAALRIPADLYIGHTLSGLAVAATAALQKRAILGFDAEDWHREEQSESDRRKGQKRAIALIEEAFVPKCAYVTAASPLIGAAYAALGARTPTTILNVFPLSEAPSSQNGDAGQIDAVYWFSQTIGPDRGIEAILRAVALLPQQWELHLRGTPSPGYVESLGCLAESLGMKERLKWLPPERPDQMVRLAAPYAVGLSVELNQPPNRAICLTNKIFTYVLAGTPVLLSDTPAQTLLAKDLGKASSVVNIEDSRAVADSILGLCSVEAREEARTLGRERYNWDFESKALVTSVRQALGVV